MSAEIIPEKKGLPVLSLICPQCVAVFGCLEKSLYSREGSLHPFQIVPKRCRRSPQCGRALLTLALCLLRCPTRMIDRSPSTTTGTGTATPMSRESTLTDDAEPRVAKELADGEEKGLPEVIFVDWEGPK